MEQKKFNALWMLRGQLRCTLVIVFVFFLEFVTILFKQNRVRDQSNIPWVENALILLVWFGKYLRPELWEYRLPHYLPPPSVEARGQASRWWTFSYNHWNKFICSLFLVSLGTVLTASINNTRIKIRKIISSLNTFSPKNKNFVLKSLKVMKQLEVDR